MALVAVFSTPALVWAQASPSTNTGNNLNIEHFRPAPSGEGLITIPEAEAQDWREWTVGLFLHYARNPLVLFKDRLQVGEVVAHRLSADVVGSLGLLRWLDAWLVIPVTFAQAGDDGLPTGSLTLAGLRDIRFGLKATVLSQKRSGILGIALVPELAIPTGDSEAFLGDGDPVFSPHLVVDRSFDLFWGFRIAGMVGVRVRPRTEIGNIEVGNELFIRAGGGLGLPEVAGLHPEAIVELFGITGLDDPFADKERNPFTGMLALRAPIELEVGHQIVTSAGVIAGFTRGYGSPDFQIFVGAMYRRYLSDRDGDGIYDHEDQCPDDPEDLDDFEDLDGCPDPDNDKDGLPDVSDRCPNDPEDIDGFEDIDGCPDPDNDQDGILDVDDKCPNDPEDVDGFEDADGCPDPDNDRDGVPDVDDKCPNEKETINGVEDEDGCPDEGEAHVEVTSEKITIDTKIHFDFDSARIREESFSILNQVALTMKANPQLTRIRVEGHTDERGAAEYNLNLSQRRAESVVEYLKGRGVEAARLEAAGYGLTRPVVNEHNEAAWAKNRRVEFTILETGDETTSEPGTLQMEPPEGEPETQGAPDTPLGTEKPAEP